MYHCSGYPNSQICFSQMFEQFHLFIQQLEYPHQETNIPELPDSAELVLCEFDQKRHNATRDKDSSSHQILLGLR